MEETNPRSEKDRPESQVWTTLKQSAKFVVWVAGFGAAIATIVGWWQLASAAANPFQDEYELLQRLAVSVDSAYFDDALGVPAVSAQVQWEGWGDVAATRHVYLQNGFLVSSIVSSEGDVIAYTVLSCDPNFKPEILTPVGSTVRLNDDSLDVENSGIDVQVHVWTLLTASSPQAQLIDVSRSNRSTNATSFGLGISEICAPGVASLPGESGPPDQLASESRDYRATHAPNYYVEADGDILEWDLVWLIPDTRGLPAGYVAELAPNY